MASTILYLGVVVLGLATGVLAPTGCADLGLGLEILHYGMRILDCFRGLDGKLKCSGKFRGVTFQ
jgi:hypothetical protein